MSWTIRPVRSDDAAEWLRLRLLLWPTGNADEYRADIDHFLRSTLPRPLPTLHAAFVCARTDEGNGEDEGEDQGEDQAGDEERSERLYGLVEVSIRPYADGCQDYYVGYLEGWFVEETMRGHGIGRALVHAAEEWARSQGCTEMASDTELDNRAGQAAHQQLGYTEAGRVVQYCKRL